MTAPTRKQTISSGLIAMAALCLFGAPTASAQTAIAGGTSSGAAQSRGQSAVRYCDRYAGSEFDGASATGMPFNRIDPKAAIPACLDAVANNPDSPRLNFQLGRAYSANGDFAKARAYFLKAADSNFALAEVNLGSLSMNGRGAPKDDSEAVKWNRLAADQGLAPGQLNLAIMYLEGRGVAKDFDQAAKLLQAAALQGFAPAQYRLAALYASGQGVRRDLGAALRLYRQAANQGFAPAQESFADAYEQALAAGDGYSETETRPGLVARQETEPTPPSPDRPALETASAEPQAPGAGQSESPTDSQPAAAPKVLPAPQDGALVPVIAPTPLHDSVLQDRQEVLALGGGDQPPVKITLKHLEHRNSTGIPSIAIEVSPLSNRFSMTGLSVNNGACQVFIQDPAIFPRNRVADAAPNDNSASDRNSRNSKAALEKIALTKSSFDQPMVAEFGQYLQFYADPAACDVREVVAVVNGHEWRWPSN
jgi:TPR repeat protein